MFNIKSPHIIGILVTHNCAYDTNVNPFPKLQIDVEWLESGII